MKNVFHRGGGGGGGREAAVVIYMYPVISHFRNINIQLDSEEERTKTIIETSCNQWQRYLHIIHFPLSLSSKPLFQAEF